jgi:signal transduction histidine kinase
MGGMMLVLVLSIACIFAMLLAFMVYIRNTRNVVNRCFAVTSLFFAFWIVSNLILGVTGSGFWLRVSYAVGSLVPCSTLLLTLYFCGVRISRNHVRILCIVSGFFALMTFTPLFISKVRSVWVGGWDGDHGAGVYFWGVYVIIYIGLLAYFFASTYIRSTGLKKLQVRYIALGLIMTGVSCITVDVVLPIFGVNKWIPVDSATSLFYLVFTAYAIAKHRLMDIRLVVTRAGIFLVLYAPVLIVPFWIGFKSANWPFATTLALVLATIGPTFYRSMQRKAEEKLMADQRRYQTTLRQAARGMVKIRELDRLVRLIVHICSKVVRTQDAYVFLYDRKDSVYRMGASRRSIMSDASIELSEGHPLIAYMHRQRGPVVIEELLMNRRDEMSMLELEEVRLFCFRYDINLVVPAATEGAWQAFLALGPKPRKQMYTTEDIEVFGVLAGQAALAIENCHFLDEFREGQERIFNAEKLATVGAMAHGLSHQLNNRLQAFMVIYSDLFDVTKLLLQRDDLSEHVRRELEYMLGGLKKFDDNVHHSAKIIRGVLDYARTEKQIDFTYVDLQTVVPPAFGLLKVKHPIKDFEPTVDIPDDLPKVFGSVSLLAEAVFNLIDNAWEAIQERAHKARISGETPPVPVMNIGARSLGSMVRLTVSDNGIGILEEDRIRMFAPFFTTKASSQSGTGLGMYVIKRIIEENHRGRITFESAYMSGTSFHLDLPVNKS